MHDAVVSASALAAQEPPALRRHERDIGVGDLFRLRMEFAARCLINNQELVRFLDQKSGLVLSAVGILTTAQGALMLRLFNTQPVSIYQQAIHGAAIACALVYLLTAFAVIVAGIKVFMPSIAPRRPNSASPGFLFPLAVLHKNQGNEDIYHQKILHAMPSEMLLDLSNQIVEIASIFAAKNSYLNIVFRRFRLLCALWLLLMLLLTLVNIVP